MKQVMEYYGGTIIAVIVAAAIIAVFWRLPYDGASGVPEILGKMVNGTLASVSQEEQQAHAFETLMSIAAPEITVNSYDTCQTGVWNYAGTYFRAGDAAGRTYHVILHRGWLASDESMKMTLSADGTRFFCSHPGEYWISASASLPNGRTREVLLKIVVNGEVVS